MLHQLSSRSPSAGFLRDTPVLYASLVRPRLQAGPAFLQRGAEDCPAGSPPLFQHRPAAGDAADVTGRRCAQPAAEVEAAAPPPSKRMKIAGSAEGRHGNGRAESDSSGPAAREGYEGGRPMPELPEDAEAFYDQKVSYRRSRLCSADPVGFPATLAPHKCRCSQWRWWLAPTAAQTK